MTTQSAIEQILGGYPELLDRTPMPDEGDAAVMVRIDVLEKHKIPHCEKMYNYYMKLAAGGERAAHKSAAFWLNAHFEYETELTKLYARLDEATK